MTQGRTHASDVLVTLKTLARRWLVPTVLPHGQEEEKWKLREDIIIDQVVKEQFLNMLPRQT